MHVQHELIATQAQLLYNVKLIKEYTNGGSGNKIFEVTDGFSNYILRVAPSSNEADSHARFELQWLDYLGKNTTEIAKPIYSLHNRLFERIHDTNQAYTLCLFEKAVGTTVDLNNPNEFNETLFFNLGVVMGKIHKLTINYSSPVTTPKFHWDDEAFSWRSTHQIMDKAVQQSERALLAKLRALPMSNDTYGIVHFDIHIDNFHVHNHKIKLFDFYDCHLNWFAADIASALFFMVQKAANPLSNMNESERTAFAQKFLIAYLSGYLTTGTINKYWINKLDLFVKFQMTDEYRCAQYYWKNELQHQQTEYLQWHKEKIINDLPYVYIDYEQVLKALPSITE